ncbi:MAG: amino acid adenylation domain-containing protein [Halanaerobiales bacterium]|nr:amino acid adenylation domain-containing protein [Halanaerobiales bacterium]
MDKNKIVKLGPLTPMQNGMLFYSLLDGQSTNYYEQMCIYLDGDIDLDYLKKAWQMVIDRHEVFRTNFVWKQVKQPAQLVLKSKTAEIYEYDISDLENAEQQNFILQFKKEDLEKRFDFEKGKLNRLTFIKLSQKKVFVCWTFHHILLDGWSCPLVLQDFFGIYNCLKHKLPLPKAPAAQFSDYLKWLRTKNMKTALKFWSNYLKDFEESTQLPYDYRTKQSEIIKESLLKEIEFDQQKTKTIYQFCKDHNITINALIQTAWGLMLQKYNYTDQSCFGMTVSGRPGDLQNVQEIVGIFINTIPVLVKTEETDTVRELLEKVNSDLVNIRDYEYVSLADIQQNVDHVESLFDSLVVFENYMGSSSKGMTNQDFTIEFDSVYELSNYDFVITVGADEKIVIKLTYNKELFNQDTIARIGNSLTLLIDTLIEKPEQLVKEISIVSEEEKKRILNEFNNSKVEYPNDKNIQQFFEEQVSKSPSATALIYDNQKMTYEELNYKSNQLARLLRNKGVKPNQIVGIVIDRSFEMMIGILGILKAGGAYLPIDPNYPIDRIMYMLENSQTEILLTEKDVMEEIKFVGEMIDIKNKVSYNQDGCNLELVNQPNDLLYIIYTSGSTGKPKGVMIEHRNVVRLLFNDKFQFDFSEKDIWTMFHSFCFDFSVWEMYGALLYGGKLVIIPKVVAQDTKKYLQVLKAQKVTVLNQTPTSFDNLSKEEMSCPDSELKIRYVIFGGEALKPIMLKDWHEKYPETKLINMFGITETTVHVTYKEIGEYEIQNNISNIGKPIPTLTTYIFDSHQKLVPIGVPGEICVGGAGVARGYLNRFELTNEKFIENPYKSGEKIYRSGDLAKWLPSGDMEYMGRIDFQVKIRGYRIEIGEIENQLLRQKIKTDSGEIEVKNAVVIPNKDSSNLIGYLVITGEVSVETVKQQIAKFLPDYMIPHHFVLLDEMPLTPNGKIDRKALKEFAGDIRVATEYVPAQNELEEKIAEIWCDVLKVNKAGMNDNFFELGGHSLKATQVISRILKEAKVEVPLRQLFVSPTIKELVKYIEKAEQSVYSSIEPAKLRDYYPVSSAQKRLFVLNELENNTSYNMPDVMLIEGDLDFEHIEKVFLELIKRHESFRTSFEMINGEVIQRIHSDIQFKIQHMEASEEGLSKIIKEFIRPFDLSKAPLLRVGLIKMKEKYALLTDVHHIISDGISTNILVSEFLQLYAKNNLPNLKLQYKDYAVWEREFMASEKMLKQENYWLELFKDEIPVLELPTLNPRPAIMSFEGDTYNFKLNKDLTVKLNQLINDTGLTLYMALLVAYHLMLSKYSGQPDIVIGSPVAGRRHPDLENVIGMFVNTLALRNTYQKNQTIAQFLEEVKENTIKAFENQDYQFEMLVDGLQLRRDLSRNPLFDVMFVLQNINDVEVSLEDVRFTQYHFENKVAKFDLTLIAFETEDEILMNLEYSTHLFSRETIEKMAVHLINIISEIVKSSDSKISELKMISEEEKNALIYEFNQTATDYPKDKTVQMLFEEQAARIPDQIAICFDEDSLTYGELNQKANQLARILRKQGVKSDELVAIMVDRSFEMIIGILSVLKAGGAYVPIDPEYPMSRIQFMLEDCNAKFLLNKSELLMTKSPLCEEVYFLGNIITLDDQKHYTGDDSNLENINQSDDLAYVIYTSGSTGKPKGVMIQHRGLTNYICWGQKVYIQGEKCDFPLYSSLSFDLTVTSIYLPLTTGNKLLIYGKEDKELLITKIIKENKVQIIKLTPAHLEIIRNLDVSDSKIKRMIVGGEELKRELALDIYEKFNGSIEIYNEYGPTETVVGCMIYKFDPQNDQRISVAIGVPADNVQIYILDNNLNPTSQGVHGEIYISGDGVARGYLNRPELTVERFIANPFIDNPSGIILGERMYKTGDLARQLPSGNLEFLGRIDHQVKIRGFRIELGEIETAILNHDQIDKAVVIDHNDDNGNKYLCAYIVDKSELSVLELREYLAKKLPDYMIPTYFITLEDLPLTPNGKVNRKALVKPDGTNQSVKEYVAPRSEVEEKLVTIWGEVLAVDKIGVYDNFFELGGHSIKATQIISLIHKEFNVEIGLRDLFFEPTIVGLVKLIQMSKTSIFNDIEILPVQDHYNLSYTQERLWIINQLESNSVAYNMPGWFVLNERVNEKLIEKVFQKLIERHESLRTHFDVIDGEAVQIIQKEVSWKLDFVDLSGFSSEEKVGKRAEIYNAEVNQTFNLRVAPLFRVKLLKMNDNEYQVIFVMHHIITDGWSMEILKEEFMLYYEAYKGNQELELQPINVQYKDFAAFQNRLINDSEKMKPAKEYWSKQLVGELPIPNLPFDYTPSVIKDRRSGSYRFVLSEDIKEKLNLVAREHDSTLFMVLFAGLNLFLFNLTGQKDNMIGIPVAGREHENLRKIIGFFVNTLILRNQIEDEDNFTRLLGRIQRNTLKAYEFQNYPLELILDELKIKYPKISVFFNMLNATDQTNEFIEDFEAKHLDQSDETKFDLTCYVIEYANGIEVICMYQKALFDQGTIENMMGKYNKLLVSIAQTPDKPIKEYNKVEKKRKIWF